MFSNFTNQISFISSFQSVPRFGHLQDVTQLLRNGVTMAQVKDYVTGILFIPCFIVAVFLLWILMSFIFACCCCGRAGFLSGKRFVRNYEEPRKCCSNARNSRITFLLSSALVVAFAAIFSLEGIVNVESSLNTFNESLKDFHSLANRGSLAANQITRQVNQAKLDRNNAVTYLSEGQAICSSTISPYINLLNNSTSLDDSTDDSLTLADAFDSLNVNTSGVDSILNDLRANRAWIIYSVPIVISFIILIFMIGTIAAWFDKSNRCFESIQSCFLLPVLFIILLVSVSLAVVLGLWNVPLSDVCIAVQKVDPIVEAFNNITKTQPGDLADRTVRYILSGCTGNLSDPFSIIQTYKSELSRVSILVANATNFTIAQQQNLTSICGIPSSDVNATITSLANLTSTLTSLKNSLNEVQTVTSCPTLYHLYDQAVNGGVCRYLTNGSGWLFVSTVVASTFMMILITLRSSWKMSADKSDIVT